LQAVILAGGLGTRLRPFTEHIPKAMVPVRGKPFLEHQILLLKSQGIEEILLLVGYRGDQIKEFFGDGSKYAIRISYSHEETLRGTGGALKLAQPKLQSNFLLLNGDTFLPMKYQSAIDCFLKFRAWGLVVVYKDDGLLPKDNLAVSSEMEVIDSDPKCARLTHINAGVMILSNRVLDMIPEAQAYSLENDLFPKLIARKSLWAYETHIRYYDMGTHDGLKRLEGFLDPTASPKPIRYW
jgi:N-acetyl-alpha-D-muramate 1-phosphate uridylyltransferase